LPKRARFTGISCTSDVCESSSFCTGSSSSADEKSRSARLMYRCSVRGAEADGEVRRRME